MRDTGPSKGPLKRGPSRPVTPKGEDGPLGRSPLYPTLMLTPQSASSVSCSAWIPIRAKIQIAPATAPQSLASGLQLIWKTFSFQLCVFSIGLLSGVYTWTGEACFHPQIPTPTRPRASLVSNGKAAFLEHKGKLPANCRSMFFP